MPSIATVAIHPSQYPDAVRRDLLTSLRTRRINHKFLYDSVKQTQKWLALHEAFSPSRHDPDCAAVYDRAFAAAARRITASRVHLIGLGCGGGQKDARLLKLLRAPHREIFYTPCDVSAAMVLVARQSALKVVPPENCFPFVCDLASAADLPETFKRQSPSRVVRLITFFGMIPNFEPQTILPRLASLVRPREFLLFSANLAPGEDYAAGMKTILPQYDNALTRDWLLTFLLDLGIERGDGELRFSIENGEGHLKRVTALFHFHRRREVEIEGNAFDFRPGESVRLFFSYRYTVSRARAQLAKFGLEILDEWTSRSGEEGVFLCRRR